MKKAERKGDEAELELGASRAERLHRPATTEMGRTKLLRASLRGGRRTGHLTAAAYRRTTFWRVSLRTDKARRPVLKERATA